MNYREYLGVVPDSELMYELFRRGKACTFECHKEIPLANMELPSEELLRSVKREMIETMFVRRWVIDALTWQCRSSSKDPFRARITTQAIFIAPTRTAHWKLELRKIDDLPEQHN